MVPRRVQITINTPRTVTAQRTEPQEIWPGSQPPPPRTADEDSPWHPVQQRVPRGTTWPAKAGVAAPKAGPARRPPANRNRPKRFGRFSRRAVRDLRTRRHRARDHDTRAVARVRARIHRLVVLARDVDLWQSTRVFEGTIRPQARPLPAVPDGPQAANWTGRGHTLHEPP
jgi:hypothetical protein